LSTALGKS